MSARDIVMELLSGGPATGAEIDAVAGWSPSFGQRVRRELVAKGEIVVSGRRGSLVFARGSLAVRSNVEVSEIQGKVVRPDARDVRTTSLSTKKTTTDVGRGFLVGELGELRREFARLSSLVETLVRGKVAPVSSAESNDLERAVAIVVAGAKSRGEIRKTERAYAVGVRKNFRADPTLIDAALAEAAKESRTAAWKASEPERVKKAQADAQRRADDYLRRIGAIPALKRSEVTA